MRYTFLLRENMENSTLQSTDIDIKNSSININKTLDFSAKNKNELFEDTKTYSSARTIRISQTLTNELKNHAKHQNKNKLAWNENYHHALNLVLSRNDGNFIPKSSLFNAFSKY